MSPTNGVAAAGKTTGRRKGNGGKKRPAGNENNRLMSSSNNNAIKMSPNAVRKMLLAEDYKEPLTVALYCNATSFATPFLAGQICDSTFQAPVLVSREQFQRLPRPRRHHWWVIKVNGYVTSTVNAAGGSTYPTFQPFLCLTTFDEVPTNIGLKKPWTEFLRNKRFLSAPQEKLPGGTSSPFIHKYLNRMDTAELWGESMIPFGKNINNNHWEENQKVVQDFLMHHKAMKNLQDSHSSLMIHHSNSNNEEQESKEQEGINNSDTPPPTNLQQQQQQHDNEHYQMYCAALREFASSQLDRQKASLTSNAGRATAMDATKVVDQYKTTLEKVLQDCRQDPQWISSRSKDDLAALHLQLCGNGLHQRAGQFRTNTVKAGRTVFCPANQVQEHLGTSLLPTLRVLQQRLQEAPSLNGHSSDQEKARKLGLACLTFACAVFFGVVDLHPFSDGNGRLARLLSQGALVSFQLPFCVNWFATPAQRREYVLAILMTRRNLSLVYRGDALVGNSSEEDLIASCLKATGVYHPLVSLLMERVRKAIPELVQLQKDKQASAVEHGEAVAARRARERAAAGSCLICFDDNPNIATLCCGKAVHLTCIAEWLSNNSSCPNCRGNFPALPPRPARRAESEEEEETTDDTTTDPFDDTTSTVSMEDGETDTLDDTTVEILVDHAPRLARRGPTETVDLEESDQDDTTVIVANGGAQQPQQQQQDEEDDTTEDDDTDIEVQLISHDPPGHQLFEEDTTDDTADDTTELVVVRSNRNPPTDDNTTDDDEDNTTTMDEDGRSDANEGTTASIDTADDSRLAGPASNGRDTIHFCAYCRNRAALECTNTCCGRCCLLHGQWRCARHSNGF